MNYDDTNIPEMYNRGRNHGPAFLDHWMNVITSRVDPRGVRDILDLGCGAGRFSQALAARFKATVIAMDPSKKMIAEALKSPNIGGVSYVNGVAEAVPLQAGSIDLIFISMVFHHFTDPHSVAEECKRVLTPNGRLCLRTASSEQIPLYPYVPFFPTSRPLLDQRLPSLAFQRNVFESALKTISCEVVTQQIAADYSAYADKIAVKADSILASLSDEEFDTGLTALRSHAAATPPQPVTEPIDFIVFGKPAIS